MLISGAKALVGRMAEVGARMRRHRRRVLGAATLALAAVLPFMIDRTVIRVERHDRTWTLAIDGEAKGTLTEPEAQPFAVGSIALFLMGEAGRPQCWSEVKLSSDGREEQRRFGRNGLGPWVGQSVPWETGLSGARPSASGEALLRREFVAAGDLALEATLIDGREGGLIVQGEDRRSRLRLWMRPEQHHDAVLTLSVAGQRVGEIPVGPVGLSIRSGLVRLLGRMIPVLIAASASGLALIWLRELRTAPPLAQPGCLARVLVAIAATSVLGAALLIERSVFESMPHVQDAVVLIFQARNFVLGRLASSSPPEPRFFDQEFVINNGLWFGKYPPGASLVYAAGLLVGALDWVNPLLAAGSILLIFFIGRRCFGDLEGTIAVAFVCVSPFVLLISASYLSHPTALFLVAAFQLLYLSPGRLGRPVLAGLCLAALILTRPQTAFAVALPLGLAVDCWPPRRATLRALTACAGAALMGVLLLLLYNRALTGSLWTSPLHVYSPNDRLGFGAVGVEWPGDFGPSQALSNVLTNIDALSVSLSGVGSFFLVLPLLPFFIGSAGDAGKWLGLSALSVVGLFFFYFHSGVFLGPRYWYETLPAIFVLAARGIGEVGRSVAVLWPRQNHRPLVASGIAFLLAAVLAITTGRRAYYEIPRHRGENGVNGRLLEATAGISGKALVFVDSKSSWQPYGGVFWTLWPDLERNRVIFARSEGIYNVHPEAAPLSNSILTARFPERPAYHWDGRSLISFAP